MNLQGVGALSRSVEAWLGELTASQPHDSVFWSPVRRSQPTVWTKVRGVEHLAILISAASRSGHEVCFASGAPNTGGRFAGVIALVQRQPLTWAINCFDGGRWIGDVRHLGYAHDNYEGFAALTAAQICWAWACDGGLPLGMSLRASR